VANWCRGQIPRAAAAILAGHQPPARCPRCGGSEHADVDDARQQYAYLLGVYLGDGCLAVSDSYVALSIAFDPKYPGIIDECKAAIEALVPCRRFNLTPQRKCACLEGRTYAKAWLCLFPQHGPGRKHHRRIVLDPWQREIVDQHPGLFARGLIHTDGWRGINRVIAKGSRYEYPRYQFSSRSDDIRRLFADACDRLGVDWRPWGQWHISVARREAVARLDEFVGPKR
jgi:hypothetical protein